ncbi:endolytic transglycosylase MltG [Persephonella sp.]
MKKLLFLIPIIITGAFIFSLYYHIHLKHPVPYTELEIKKGYTIHRIGEILKEKGIIQNRTLFILYARIKDRPLKYGYYSFEGNLSIADVWSILNEGRERLIKFTIVPGDDLLDIGQKLENKGIIDRSSFYSYVFNSENTKKMGLEGSTFEGYFPPETYYLRKNSEPEELVKNFLKLFREKYAPVIKKTDILSPYQVMIVASLVEKETSIREEKPLIAGVIINRLKKKMKLQIDPTVIYALKLAGQWDGNLTKKNMKIDSLYNTYLYRGLPPTPISSFSIESLEAVLNFAETDFLYFYSKDGKRHIFSRTYLQHLKNIK